MAARPRKAEQARRIDCGALALAVVVVRSRVGQLPRLPPARSRACLRLRRRRRPSAQIRKQDAAIARQREQLQRRADAGPQRRLRFLAVRRQVAVAAARSTPRSSGWSAISTRCSASARQLAGGGSRRAARPHHGCARSQWLPRQDGARQRAAPARGRERQRAALFDQHFRRRHQAARHDRRARRSRTRIAMSAASRTSSTAVTRTFHGVARQLPHALRAHLRRLLSSRCPAPRLATRLRARPAELPASCPGTEVQIYYHREQGQESAEAWSRRRPASPMRTADSLSLQQTDTPRPAAHCGCNRRRGTSASIAGNPPADRAGRRPSRSRPSRARGRTRPPIPRRWPTRRRTRSRRARAHAASAVERRPARRAQGQGRRASVPSRPRRGKDLQAPAQKQVR